MEEEFLKQIAKIKDLHRTSLRDSASSDSDNQKKKQKIVRINEVDSRENFDESSKSPPKNLVSSKLNIVTSKSKIGSFRKKSKKSLRIGDHEAYNSSPNLTDGENDRTLFS